MASLYQILLIVLPVFIVIGVGFGLRKTSILSPEFIFQLNRLVFYVALPLLLFHKISSADFSESFNPTLIIGVVGATTLTFLFSYLYGLVRKYPACRIGAFSQASSRSNVAYIALAICFNAYGEEGLAAAGIIAGLMVPAMNVLSVLVLLLPMKDQDHGMGRSFWLQQFALNPLIIASCAGITWSFLELQMVEVVERSLSILTGMALPLALLSIGGSFSLKRLKGDLRVVILASVVKTVLMPLGTVLLLYVMGIRGQGLGIGYILAAAPTAAAAFIMAQQLKSDAELTGSIIMVSTLLSLFSYTAGLYVLKILQL